MEKWFMMIKDALLIISPIVVAYISYRSNKKSKQDLQNELEKSLKEKDAETAQALQKISAELESQKAMAVWNNSLPQTDEYTKLAGPERYGNVCSLAITINEVHSWLNNPSCNIEDVVEIKKALDRIPLPQEDESLYPYEVMKIVSFKRLKRDVAALLENHKSQESFEE